MLAGFILITLSVLSMLSLLGTLSFPSTLGVLSLLGVSGMLSMPSLLGVLDVLSMLSSCLSDLSTFKYRAAGLHLVKKSASIISMAAGLR